VQCESPFNRTLEMLLFTYLIIMTVVIVSRCFWFFFEWNYTAFSSSATFLRRNSPVNEVIRPNCAKPFKHAAVAISISVFMLGSNMLQARMATRVAKPNGQFWLRPDDVTGFMGDKKVTDLPGRPELIVLRLEAVNCVINTKNCITYATGKLTKEPAHLVCHS